MTLNYFDDKYTYSFNFIICSIIYSFFISKYDGEICVKYLKLLESKERELYSINDENIIYIFVKFLNNRNEEESNYLLNKIFENSLIEINQKIISRTLYFSHYLYSYEIFKYESFVKYKSFYKNIRILKKHNWKLHKKLIKEGVNPNEIAKIIRNDEIEKLQEISSQTNFDFNQRIEPSLYERCSIINKEDVSLIDYAAFFSAVKCFKYLLMNGANVEKTGKYAIAGGNEEIIHLCEQNHSLLACAYETAIEFHQNEIFKYIYENKLRKIYSLEELGTKCILSHNYEILSFLQNEGMQICDLHIIASIETGNLYLIQYLLEQYVIDTYIPRISTISWNKELFNYLVTKNYINIKNKNDMKKIFKSSCHKRLFDLAMFLIENELVDVDDEDGFTALIYASSNGQTEIVKLLLKQKGIKIIVKNNWKNRALSIASEHGQIELVKLILEQEGFVINCMNDVGKKAILLASEKGHIKIVKLLLEKGIDINAKYNKTALIWASEKGHIKIVKLLLEHEGIDINTKCDYDGITALMIACQKGNKKIVKLLLEQEGIDINAKDKDGQTALIEASKNGNTEIAKLLLEQEGIDINAKDHDGQTALMYASKNGNTEIVKLLSKQK